MEVYNFGVKLAVLGQLGQDPWGPPLRLTPVVQEFVDALRRGPSGHYSRTTIPWVLPLGGGGHHAANPQTHPQIHPQCCPYHPQGVPQTLLGTFGSGPRVPGLSEFRAAGDFGRKL